MLTSIEIAGFKSFADRVRIDFSEGISVIVGPNGSGKSNIVDAIKWVLGEQSIKKLRGSEMADVIFGGSKTRSPANMAEVTLTFDNKNRFFSLDTDELHLTRRLYRNGDSEYLINRQAVRLKDIRDLLTGSGLGAQAYSIIEQGRVELLLQSTALQRRAILEDAAGTSLFNARSVDALRRLERVDQNLFRIADMVRELENQYKRTKSQAGKAEQQRQYLERYKLLRTEAALIEWQRSKIRLQQFDSEAKSLADRCAELNDTVNRAELIQKKYRKRFQQVEHELRTLEGELGDAREEAASGESVVRLQMTQIFQLDKEIEEQCLKIQEIKLQNGDATESIKRTANDILDARRIYREVKSGHDFQKGELDRLTAECETLHASLDQNRKSLQENRNIQIRLGEKIDGLNHRLQPLHTRASEKEARYRELTEALSAFLETDSRFKGELSSFNNRLENTRRQIDKKKSVRDGAVLHLDRLNNEIREMQQRFAADSERLSLLKDLVRNQEGLSSGVKEVLRLAKDSDGIFRHVHGLVADLIRVSAEAAPLIESILGQKAQYVVVSPDAALFAHLERMIEEDNSVFSGRVGFIWLSNSTRESKEEFWKEPGLFDGLPGVVGRADRFVETNPKFESLVYRLLGRTWIVDSLKTAKRLFALSQRRSLGEEGGIDDSSRYEEADFIALSGEALLSNGTLLVGSAYTSDGQITRRTEIRTLSEKINALQSEIVSQQTRIAESSGLVERLNGEIDRDENDLQQLQNETDDLRLRWTAHRQQDKNSQREFQLLKKEIEDLSREEAQIVSDLNECKTHKQELDKQTVELEETVNRQNGELTRSDKFRKDASRKLTDLQIQLAKSEAQITALLERQRQFDESLCERRKNLREHLEQLDLLRARREKAENKVLHAETAVAEQTWRKEKMTEKRETLMAKKEGASVQVSEIDDQLKTDSRLLAKAREEFHRNEMDQERIGESMKNLADAMREDYGIDLPGQVAERFANLNVAGDGNLTEDVSSFKTSAGTLEDCHKEINLLKVKIQRLGSVNPDAIKTLEDLRSRFEVLSKQYKDLETSKHSIMKIVARTDRQRQALFKETFDAVRGHFLSLFQQLFGGGHADIVFEDPDTPMTSGVDIIARPPGKDLKNVALLSGGEKTLTSVAFLLALFQYRSSPICILDEVDAALDEVNVDRFSAVVRDFKTDTQFIMITHSKKTMMAAKTLYGVTMQESGVSKLIAVQFDEVGEDGEIIVKDPPRRAAA